MNTSSFSHTESQAPGTFQARGIAVPFTTPLLSAVRVKLSSRHGAELMMPNPAGGRGVYVLQWDGVRALCSPTVHDTLLFEQISSLSALDPRAVRGAALAVALEGHAGHDAAVAAGNAMTADRNQKQMANFLLLQRIIEQTEPNGPGQAIAATPEFEGRARAALQRVAPTLRRPAQQLLVSMSALSDAFAPVGVGPQDRTARIPRLIERLEDTKTELADWLEQDPEHDAIEVGPAITAAMRSAANSARALLASTRIVLGDSLALLGRHVADPAGVAALAERADWMLDGWERVCLIWQAAADVVSRRTALLEMAQSIPELPREAFEWTNPCVPIQIPEQSCRVTGSDRSWCTRRASVVLIQRNERLRAMSI